MVENGQQNILPVAILPEEDSLDFKKLLYTFLQNWPWFLGSVFICMLLAFIYLRYTVPVYNIHSKILIKDDKSSTSGASTDLMSQLDIFNTGNNVNDEKEVLQTYYLVRRVVDELQLNVRYFAVGNIKSTELYKKTPFKLQLIYLKDSIAPQTFDFRFSANSPTFTVQGDNLTGKYRLSDTIKTANVSFIVQWVGLNQRYDNDYQVVITTPDVATESYLSDLTFDISDKQASVIEVTVRETVPQKGEDILNKLYEVYTRMNEEDKNKIADSTIRFIAERLAVVSRELSGVEKDIEQFKVENRLSTNIPEQATLALNNASDVQKQLTEQDVQITIVQSLEDHLKGNNGRIVPNAAIIQDPTYITTVQEYNTLVLERDRQLQTTKSDNPLIQSLNSQIEAVKRNLIISLDNIKKEMQISRNELANKNDQFMNQMKTVPSKERAFLDISRQQDVKQQLYLYLLQKREETAISKSGTLANSRLIEPGKSDALPFIPKKWILYLTALCAGILLPAASIYIKNLLNNTVENGLDIEKETTAPVLGELGHNSSGRTIVAEENSRTALSEQFRALRTNLQFLLKGKEQQVVMITSSASGEGKSFFTINLGLSLAISNKRVVLMELDLRKPKISSELGLSKELGFTDYLVSKSKKEELLKSTPLHPNLFLISSGTIPPNPAELLLNKEVDELFAWLRTRFDYIIVDTPPAGVVIDAVLIGKYADASIYVVRLGYTLKDQLKMIHNFKQSQKLPNLSILINDVKLKGSYSYKYNGYHYGYGYGYESDYYLDEKKQKRNLFRKANKS
jgi:tyrosine-protein kinase Etk/Wzc